MDAGKLRHRVTIRQPIETQDTITGAISVVWSDFVSVWASIEPLSAREFVASQAQQSKVSLRIVIRTRNDITSKMKIHNPYKGKTYQIEGVLFDKESGNEYITLPCSELENDD